MPGAGQSGGRSWCVGSVVLLTCDSACPTALNHKPHTAHKRGLLTSVLRKPSHLLVWMMLHILLSFSFFFFFSNTTKYSSSVGGGCEKLFSNSLLQLSETHPHPGFCCDGQHTGNGARAGAGPLCEAEPVRDAGCGLFPYCSCFPGPGSEWRHRQVALSGVCSL